MKICEEYASLLDPFIDGELDGDEAARVREHLASCPACAAYAADAMAIRAAFGDIDDTEVPEGLADGVMAVIRAHAVPQKKKNQWIKAAASLAACALIVFAAVRVMPFGGSSGAVASSSASGAADGSASTEMQTRDMENSLDAKEDNDQLPTGSELEGSLYSAGAGSNEKTTAPAQETPNLYGMIAPSDTQDDAGGEAPSINSITSGNGASSGEDSWVEYDNVVFASVVQLPSSQQLTDLLSDYEGKPYSNVNSGDTGTGYAMTSDEMETILDKISCSQEPTLNPDRTTDLCCIVVIESGK